MFCKNCGTKLEDGASFCHICGTPVETSEIEVEAAEVEEIEEVDEIEETEAEEIEKVAKEKPAPRTSASSKKWIIIIAAVVIVALAIVVMLPKNKKDDAKKSDSEKESIVTDDKKSEKEEEKKEENDIDWKQAYRDFFAQDEQDVTRCKLIELEALEYPMLVYEADEGSLKYELLYLTKDGKAESVLCYSNTTEVYYSQDGIIFANMNSGLSDRYFYTWEYDSSTDQFVEVKKGVAVLDQDYYNETYGLRYEYTINDEACDEPDFELYIREVEADYNYVELNQEDEKSVEELLDSEEQGSEEEEEVELDTDWALLEPLIEDKVLPAYKNYIAENYGSGEVDAYSLLCVDADKIPEALFDKSGDGSGTVLLTYDLEMGVVHESDASCRGYNFMYEPRQNYVALCYAGNGLESYTVAHMEDFELVVDQTFSCIWIGDETELEINEKECTVEEFKEIVKNTLDSKALVEGWNEFASMDEAYEELGHYEYLVYGDEISKFEINGDQLMITGTDGAELNFTVSDSLEWEIGSYEKNGLEIYDRWKHNEMKEHIEAVRAECLEKGYCDSPGVLHIEIRDEQVVRLYVILS